MRANLFLPHTDRGTALDAPGLSRAGLTALAAVFAAGFFVVDHALRGRPALLLETPLDRAIPFWPPAVVAYGLILVFLFIPVLQVRDLALYARAVRAFCGYNVVALAIFVLFPTRVRAHEGLAPGSLFAWGIGLVEALDPGYNAFPSLHVANAVFVALLARRLDPRVGTVVAALAAAIAVSTLLVKQHWVLDVAGGATLGAAGYAIGVAPAVPAGARTADLVLPRRRLLALPVAYGLAVAALAIAHAWGKG